MDRSRPVLEPRRRPVQRRSRDTVAFVLEAAAQVFEERGYTAATTNRVAERAGVSIGTLYQYFPNKDALLLALVREHVARAGAELRATAAGLRRAAPALPGVVQALVAATVALNDRPLHRVLFQEAPRPPDVVEELDRLHAEMAGEVAWHLRRNGTAEDRAELAALVLVHAVDNLVHNLVLRPPASTPPDRIVEEIVTMCLSYAQNR